jgi:radical SAM protein with 4Fe4S-binding SPASM domain
MKRAGGEMTDELFHKIVEEGMSIGVRYFIPFLNGEPFLFPRLYEWLDYLQDRDLTFTLYTNAISFTKEHANRINAYKNITEIIFSMHGYDKLSYEIQMRVPYEPSKANIDYFISIAKIPYRVHMISSVLNSSGVAQFRETWGDHAYTIKYANWAGKRPSSMKGVRYPCQRVLSEMTVYWDGRVNLCCMDSDAGVILGDLNTQSVKEVWESNQWMRDKHRALDFDLTLCKDCNFSIS